jgi:hypothetical protein
MAERAGRWLCRPFGPSGLDVMTTRSQGVAKEPSPTNGPLHGMKTANFFGIKNIATILPRHGQSPFPNMPNENATPQN